MEATMPTIRDSYDGLQALESSLTTRLQEIEELKGRILGKRKEVIDQLKSGESLGDPMLDFVAARHAEGYFDTMESLGLLADEFKRHAGELVLLRYQELVCIKHVFAGSGSQYEWRERLRIGLITDDDLDFQKNPAFCNLPVERFVVLHPPSTKISNVITSLCFTVSSATPLPLDAPLPKEIEEVYIARLIIGDDAVKAFLETRFQILTDDIFRTCCERLGKLVLTG